MKKGTILFNHLYRITIKMNKYAYALYNGGKTMTLHNRDFLTLKDFTQKEITYLLNLAAKLKKDKKAGITHGTLTVSYTHLDVSSMGANSFRT